MKTRLFTIFSLSTALVLSGQLAAHEDHKNNNNHIDFYRVGDFDDVDTNKDGKVSRDEYLDYRSDSRRYDREWREEHWDEMIEKFDYDEDDQITTAEVEEYVDETISTVMSKLSKTKWFDGDDFDFEFDGDDFAFDFDGHDFHGDFDADEFGERLAERMDRLHERIERSIDRVGRMEFRSHPRFELKRGHRIIERDLDENEDGVVSKEEFLEEREDLFERLDKNEDGKLDEEELDRFPFGGTFAFEWDDDDDEDNDNDE